MCIAKPELCSLKISVVPMCMAAAHVALKPSLLVNNTHNLKMMNQANDYGEGYVTC